MGTLIPFFHKSGISNVTIQHRRSHVYDPVYDLNKKNLPLYVGKITILLNMSWVVKTIVFKAFLHYIHRENVKNVSI